MLDFEIPAELRMTLDELRRQHASVVLEACHGNRTAAARILGVDRKTLLRRLQRWGLVP